MSEDSIYQQLRGHLAYLPLVAAAEALPGELDHAMKAKLTHTAFLEPCSPSRCRPPSCAGVRAWSASPRCPRCGD